MSEYLTDADPGDETQPRQHLAHPFTARCLYCGLVGDFCGSFPAPCEPEPDGD